MGTAPHARHCSAPGMRPAGVALDTAAGLNAPTQRLQRYACIQAAPREGDATRLRQHMTNTHRVACSAPTPAHLRERDALLPHFGQRVAAIKHLLMEPAHVQVGNGAGQAFLLQLQRRNKNDKQQMGHGTGRHSCLVHSAVRGKSSSRWGVAKAVIPVQAAAQQ